MKFIYNLFSSIKFSILLLITYVFSAGLATFVENDFGTAAAKWLVYQALWFNILHLLLIVNFFLVADKFNMFSIKKLPVFLFHFAFVLIITGAAITRFISYEGIMHIRVGQTTNTIATYDTYVKLNIVDGNYKYEYSKRLEFNRLKPKANFSEEINFNNKKYTIKLIDYIPNAGESIIKSDKNTSVIDVMISDNTITDNAYIKEGKEFTKGETIIYFDNKIHNNNFSILKTDSGLFFESPYPVISYNMQTQTKDTIPAHNLSKLYDKLLYSWSETQFVVKNIYKNSDIALISQTDENKYPLNALTFELSDGKNKKTVTIFGKESYTGSPEFFKLGNSAVELSFGSRIIKLPFSLRLNKFKVDHYPGSMSPSAYESYITLIDKEHNVNKDYKIFMNNVLSYRGYRFYQSSYDPDEKGTILSVNHDSWGTIITYIGYLLMTIGMFLSLFSKNGRFMQLNRKLKELSKQKSTLIIVFLLASLNLFSQDLPKVPEKQANKFGYLLLQDNQGRIKPVNTTTNELIRKISKRSTYKGLNSDQIMLSMLVDPQIWTKEPLIKITDPYLIKLLNAKDKHVSLKDLFDENRHYKIQELVNTAYSKAPAHQSKLDKNVIKLDEKVNILYMMLNGEFLNIFPKINDPKNKWYNINDIAKNFSGNDSIFVTNVYHLLITGIYKGIEENNWADADTALKYINIYQYKVAKDLIPPESKIKAEVFYNKASIFRHLFEFYFIAGFVFLIILFAGVLIRKFNTRKISLVFFILLLLAFILHSFGLVLRWYVSGHAPWSNGYESMIYIAWATMLAGIIFYKKSEIALAATTILSGMILLVAHLSWIDPQITNLVPVLKSYWLTIHVAVITASYGFVSLGALLGFINLVLMIFLNNENKKRILLQIKQLTYINEMTLIAGLFLLSIGTFLGGVWANESWGRYWGWDSKETWALITMLVYAIVLHMRFVKSLRGIFIFNLASLLAISSVIMTYFGVNFYLSGLHSYAKGDPVPIPAFVYYSIAVIFVVSVLAYVKKRRFIPSEN